MKRPVVSVILMTALMLAAGLGRAGETQAARDLFRQGNAHYQNGDYPAADRCYRLLLDRGIESGAVYYNLGNACFKSRKLGEAIYYWEKARRKLPRDSDVRENLQFAGLLVVDRIDVPEDPLPVRIVSGAAHLLTAAQESKIVLGLFVAANLLFGFYFLLRTRRAALRLFIAGLAAALLMILFAASLGWKLYQESHLQEGVIVAPKADIRSAPGGDGITVVTVHEGIKVQVRGEAGGWYQITLPNGWTGWLPPSALRIL